MSREDTEILLSVLQKHIEIRIEPIEDYPDLSICTAVTPKGVKTTRTWGTPKYGEWI